MLLFTIMGKKKDDFLRNRLFLIKILTKLLYIYFVTLIVIFTVFVFPFFKVTFTFTTALPAFFATIVPFLFTVTTGFLEDV